MDMIKSFSNKVVLVTGGAGGLGFSIAEKFINYNSKVYIAKTNQSKNYPDKCNIINCNFLIKEEFENLLSKISTLKIDILINNAGINKIDPFEKILPKDYQEIQMVNTYAPFRITQKVIQNMKKEKSGEELLIFPQFLETLTKNIELLIPHQNLQ